MRHSRMVAAFCAVGLSGAFPLAAAAEPTKHECVKAHEDGQDQRRLGRLRLAADAFRMCSAQTCPAPVRDDCLVRLGEIERVTPTVIFDVRDARGTVLTTVSIWQDESILTNRVDGAVAVDPGSHRLVVKIPGGPAKARDVILREGEKNRRVAIRFEDDQAPASSTDSKGEEKPESPTNVPAILAFTVAGAGLVVAGVSGYVYLDAVGEKKCRDGYPCPEDFNVAAANDNVKVASTIFWIAAPVTVVTAALGTWFLVRDGASQRRHGDISSVRIAPVIGLGWASVAGVFQ